MSIHQIDWESVLGPCALGLTSQDFLELNQGLERLPPRCVRVAPRVGDQEPLPFSTKQVPWYKPGKFLAEDVLPGSLMQHAAGDYYVQDAGSLLALALCDLQGDELVLDACAAPGGKSTGILEQLHATGFLIANEVIGSRVSQLQMACERSGATNFLVYSRELAQLAEWFPEAFDCVLVDAPCSGQSLVVRGKQSMSAFTPSHIEHNAARQQSILRSAATTVKPGGKLVYSTCTFSYAENEAIVARFLEENPDWCCERHESLAAWESSGFPGCYRLWPHRDSTTGAFAAALVFGPEDEAQTSAQPQKMHRKTGKRWKSQPAERLEWPFVEFGDLTDLVLWQTNDSRPISQLLSVPAKIPEGWLEHCKSGPVLATRKGQRWIPSYLLARTQHPSLRPRLTIKVSDPQAQAYVAGEEIRLSEENLCSAGSDPSLKQAGGWCVVQWRERPLGWSKVSNGVAKNHFPKPLRQAVQVLD